MIPHWPESPCQAYPPPRLSGLPRGPLRKANLGMQAGPHTRQQTYSLRPFTAEAVVLSGTFRACRAHLSGRFAGGEGPMVHLQRLRRFA
jgi:hypothetical protein